jgi:rhodanese-related sulfurtransferase
MSPKLLFAAIFLIVCLPHGQAGHAEDTNSSSVTSIDVKSARDYVSSRSDAVILDVRTPVEFEMSHIPDAVNVDVQDAAFEEMAKSLDRDKAYIVHCTKNPADGRSSRALATLRELGFSNLYSLEGGYVAWKEADLPLVEDAN